MSIVRHGAPQPCAQAPHGERRRDRNPEKRRQRLNLNRCAALTFGVSSLSSRPTVRMKIRPSSPAHYRRFRDPARLRAVLTRGFMPFSKLGLSDKVIAAVTSAGYPAPTPIQEQAIPHVLARRDVLGIAQTGTGKTAAFTLPMLTMLEQGRARARMPRTLILEPTRELAAQVQESFEKYGAKHKLNVALLIGGVSFDDQDNKIMRGVDVLIATPGRLLDHFE